MRVLGIDLSLRNTGVVILEGTKLIHKSCLKTKATKSKDFHEKVRHDIMGMKATSEMLILLFDEYDCDEFAFEVPDFAQGRQMAVSLGLCRIAILPFVNMKGVLYRPSEVKKISLTGNSKDDVKSVVSRIIPSIINDVDHIVDAAAVALFHQRKTIQNEITKAGEAARDAKVVSSRKKPNKKSRGNSPS